jgi:hypothetical protein
MYQKQISQKISPSLQSIPNQEISANPNYAPLSTIVQRVQQDPNNVSKDEREKLESAIGTKSTKEILTGNKTSWVPEFKGISSQLWGYSGQVEPIQAKLTMGEVGDKYEQEADRVAKDVVQRINTPSTQNDTFQRQQTKELQLKKESVNEILQRRETTNESEVSTNLESAINSAKGSGQPLDTNLQQSMGQAIGADFSGVKIHTDAQSDRLNRSIQAKAFTTGQDVFFRQGEYQPGNREGQELIAHELTHVVQQKGSEVEQKSIQEHEKSEAKVDCKAETASHLTTVQKFAISNIGHNILQAMSLNKGKVAFSNVLNKVLNQDNYKQDKPKLIKLLTEANFQAWLVNEKNAQQDNPYNKYKNEASLMEFVKEFIKIAIDNVEYQKKSKEKYVPPVIGLFENSTLLVVDDSSTNHFGSASVPKKQLVTNKDLNEWFEDEQGKGMIEKNLKTIYVYYQGIERSYPVYKGTPEPKTSIGKDLMGGFYREWDEEGVQSIFMYEMKNETYQFMGWIDFDHIPTMTINDNQGQELIKPNPYLSHGHVHPGEAQGTQEPLTAQKYQKFREMAKFICPNWNSDQFV